MRRKSIPSDDPHATGQPPRGVARGATMLSVVTWAASLLVLLYAAGVVFSMWRSGGQVIWLHVVIVLVLVGVVTAGWKLRRRIQRKYPILVRR